MAGKESFELSIEVLQVFKLKMFRVITIPRSGAFGEVSIADFGLIDEVVQWKDQEFHSALVNPK